MISPSARYKEKTKANLSKAFSFIVPAKTSVRVHGVDPKIRDLPPN
jgi:hypothetical protein